MRVVWISIALASALLMGQQATQTKAKQAPAPKEQPKQESGGLFKNKLGYQSSKQNQDSMTLGFNGIDPAGRVDKETLDKQPTADHRAQAAKMAANRPTAAELQAFVKQGGLN